jgi:hypothetical protein
MSWRGYYALMGVTVLLLAGAIVAPLVGLDASEEFVRMLVRYGAWTMAIVGLLTGVVMIGSSITMPNRVSCPHCKHRSDVALSFWTSKPRLERSSVGDD